MFCFLYLAPYARTTRYEEAFFSLGKPRKKRLASLARLIIMYWLYVMLLTAEQGAGERNYYSLLGKTGELSLELSVVVDTRYKVYY